jgi:hypothetical protein
VRKWLIICLILVALIVLSLGCAGENKGVKVRCPKCGTVFTVHEGLQEYQMISH